MLVELENDIGEGGRDLFLVLDQVGCHPEKQARVTLFA